MARERRRINRGRPADARSLRDEIASWRAEVDADGTVSPPEGPGLGVEIDGAALARFPVIDGPGYV